MKKTVYILLVTVLSMLTLNAKSYKYDNLNRVVEVRYESGAKIYYAYDEAGNMIHSKYVPKPQPYVSVPENGATQPCVIKELPKGQSGVCMPIVLGEEKNMSTIRFSSSLDLSTQTVDNGIKSTLGDEMELMLYNDATMNARVSFRNAEDELLFSSINTKFVVSDSVVDENSTIETTMQVADKHKIVMTLNTKGDVDVMVSVGEKKVYVDSNFINSHVYVDENGSVTIYREMRRKEKILRTLITIDKKGATLMRFIEVDQEGTELRELHRQEKLSTYNKHTNINILEVSNEMYISLETKLNGKIVEE